jgi:hypothetical protein
MLFYCIGLFSRPRVSFSFSFSVFAFGLIIFNFCPMIIITILRCDDILETGMQVSIYRFFHCLFLRCIASLLELEERKKEELDMKLSWG